MKFILFCIFLFSGLRAFAEATAKVQGVLLSADSLFRDTDNETMELDGNVQIVFQNQHIKCDKAKVNFRTRQAELTGHVEIVSQKNNVGGSAATIDYENNTGLIYNGFVQSGQVTFSGSLLQRVSEDEYYVTDADYTTCTNCAPTWGFSGSNIRAQLGGYAYIKNSFLKVFSVPVFWMPYLIVPLKSDRQTGLLTPGFESSSNGGLAFSQSLFWAINRSTDATFTVKNYEKRGLKGMAEYRYVLTPDSSGSLSTAFLNDRVFKTDPRLTTMENDSQKNQDINRWFVKYEHYYELPHDYIQRAQINAASDLQYPKDFPTETLNHGDSAMENRVSLTKNTFDQHTSIDSSYYVNMLQTDPMANNADAVHRLPEIRFSQIEQKIANSQWLYSYDLDYTNFARSGQAWDNMTNTTDTNGNKLRYVSNTCANQNYQNINPDCRMNPDGTFDPSNDLLRTGQRLDMNFSLFRPFNVSDFLDVLPSISYRETYYNFTASEDHANIRRYLRGSISAKTSMNRVFIMDEGPKATKFKHEFQPEVIATAIPWLSHPKHPFFGTGDEADGTFYTSDTITDQTVASPYGLQFDYNDRIYDRGLVTFVLNNKLVQKKWVGDAPNYLQVVNLKIMQSYDTYQANLRNATRDPWSDIATILDVRFDHVQTYSTFNYFPEQKVTNISSRLRLNNDFGQFFQIGLTKNYKITPGVEVDAKSRTEDYTFGAGFLSKYINLMGKFVYDANWVNATGEKKIKSWAYIAQFKPPGDCWMINLTQDQITGGDTNLKLEFAFNFDGQPKAPIPPEALDSFGF